MSYPLGDRYFKEKIMQKNLFAELCCSRLGKETLPTDSQKTLCRWMMIFAWQFAVLSGILFCASKATSATTDAQAVSPPPAQANAQNDDDDEGDDWVFDSGPYTDNPKTGRRVWQYAKEKPAYQDAPSGYSIQPRYYGSDPFFLPYTDMMFFLNTPDPLFAEPTGYPPYNDGIYGADRYFYGLGSGSYPLYRGESEN
jgi:hypothetical protein